MSVGSNGLFVSGLGFLVSSSQGLYCGRASDAVRDAMHPFFGSATGAAEDFATRFNAVADNLASAVLANWRQRLDGALEAIEGVRLARSRHLERLVVIASTNFALCHGRAFLIVHPNVA